MFNLARKTLIVILNIIKVLSIYLGSLGFMFFICGLDSTGAAGKFFITGFCISIILLISSFFNEAFVVMFLLKKNEHIKTFYNCEWYHRKYAKTPYKYERS